MAPTEWAQLANGTESENETDKRTNGRIAALLYAPLNVGRDIKFPCTHYFHLRGVLTAAVDGQRWPAAMRAVL